jgi:UDP-glucose:(heptosyl)LPS alpha-1,3-glucosyltransferase
MIPQQNFTNSIRRVVLLKSRSNNHGGLEKYASRIAKAFEDRGCQVSILTTGDTVKNSSIPVFATRTLPWPAFLRMEQFDSFVRNWLKKNPADLIFGMDRNRFQTHIRAGNGVHAAYLKSRIITEGSIKAFLCQINPLHRKILELEKTAFENPALQKLFTNSHFVRSQVLHHYKVDPSKIEVIHNGVEWQEMQSDFNDWEQQKEISFKKFALDPSHFHFLFIGNGYLRKGLDRLLLGLSQLKSESFHLSVIGKDNRMDFYHAKAVQLGLKDRVRFFGPSQEIRQFYQLADCLVIPSFYDPFANVTVEALAMGLFVLSSKLNGGHEILTKTNGSVIEDLMSIDAIIYGLQTAMKNRKTKKSADEVRETVKHLDFSNQLRILMSSCG